MRRQGAPTIGRVEPWIGLGLLAGVVLAWAWGRLVANSDGPQAFAPDWLPPVAAAVATVGIVPVDGSRQWLGVQRVLRWTGLLLMVWAANGLPFDVLTAGGLMGHRTASGEIVLASVSWPGLVTRSLALAVAIVLARVALTHPAAAASSRTATWYGYAAFLLALPYPVLRIHWAMGGSLGLAWPGAAGVGWEPLLLAIPWLAAAALALLLVAPPGWMPRRLLLAAGWAATTIVAMIGPAALWSAVSALAGGGAAGSEGIQTWVFALFYGSWFLFAMAAGAATLSYQRRSAPPTPSPA
jgi:hypothetical protein